MCFRARSEQESQPEAFFYNTVSGTENERFRIENPGRLSIRPEIGDFFRLPFSGIVFGSVSSRKRGVRFLMKIPIRKWHPDLVLHVLREATSFVTA